LHGVLLFDTPICGGVYFTVDKNEIYHNCGQFMTEKDTYDIGKIGNGEVYRVLKSKGQIK